MQNAGVTLSARVRFKRPLRHHASFELAVDFQVGPGITILFGASGAGKSTLLDCIAGLLKPRDARITLGQKTLQDSTAGIFLSPQTRNIAYLFQAPALFPHMTVEQNAGYGLARAAGPERRAAVFYLLELFRGAHLAHRKPGEISGGEAQRGALAPALAPSPRAGLPGEPLQGLDAELKSSVVDDLRAWN